MAEYPLLDAALAYLKAGISIIPDDKDKKPALGNWKIYQQQLATPAQARSWFYPPPSGAGHPYLGAITGGVSGNLHAFDFDADEDQGESFNAFRTAVEQELPDLWEQFVIVRSRSGGYHLYFRCAELGESGDLAAFKNHNGERRQIIEAKANGRQMVAYPSPGYELEQGEMTAIPKVTPEEMTWLYALARKQDKSPKTRSNGGKNFQQTETQPGSQYAQAATLEDVKTILVTHQWTVVHEEGDHIVLERPGKSEGSTSAHLDLVDGVAIFYCFSSNAEPFESFKGYNAFQVRGLLDFAGDFKACAKTLRKEGFGGGEDDEKTPPPDQLDCALEFQRRYHQQWAFDVELGDWRYWNGQYWAQQNEQSATKMLTAMGDLVRGYGRRGFTCAIYNNLMTLLKVNMSHTFSSRQGIISFANGTLDCTGAESFLRENRPEDLIGAGMPYTYQADGAWPRITVFLEEVIPDAVARGVYAGHLGLALLRDTRLHVATCLEGPRNSGKSTAYQLANLVCGNDMVSGAGGAIFQEDSEGMRSRATWNERILVAIDELPADALRHENTTKAMLAHSSVSMRHLHQRELRRNQWRPKVLFTCNEPPRFSDRTAALMRRLVFILFPVTREDNDPTINRNLIYELQEEVGAFAVHCIDTALEIRKQGHYPQSTGMRAHANTVELEGDALKAFVVAKCVFDAHEVVPTQLLYQQYLFYCATNGHQGVLALPRFGRAIVQRFAVSGIKAGLQRVGGTPTRVMSGLRLRHLSEGEVEEVGV